MPDVATTERLIEKLHVAPVKYVLALTGGGTTAAAQLLSVPGGSRNILEIQVPYHEQALIDYLGQRLEHFCSVETARALARRAHERAMWLAPAQSVIGLGATASLATDRPKRGDHRFHVATCSATETHTWSLILNKGARDRAGEEAVLDAVILTALARALGVTTSIPIPVLAGEKVEEASEPAGGLGAFFRGEVKTVCVHPDGQVVSGGEAGPAALLPGAFHPIHEGHWHLAATAERILGKPVAFELSLENVDKPPLTPEEVRARLAQFSGRAAVWLTRAATFVEKARLFPGATFVVGADTAERIVAARYYEHGEAGVSEALDLIRRQGCRFLVACRVDAAGAVHHLDDVPFPAPFRDLFSTIPEAQFREDISSTEIRSQGSGVRDQK